MALRRNALYALVLVLGLASRAEAQAAVARINFGSLGAVDGYTAYDPAALSGDQGFYTGPTSVAPVYRQHVWGQDLAYQLPLADGQSYNIKLHFAETYNPYCKVGFRVMEMSAGAKTVTVDTFASAGCNTPYVLDINDVTPTGGILVIKGVKVNVQNAFLSAIEAFEASGDVSPVPTIATTAAASIAPSAVASAAPSIPVGSAPPSAAPSAVVASIVPSPPGPGQSGEAVARINFGSLGAVNGYTAYSPSALVGDEGFYTGPTSVSPVYRQHVWGPDLTYNLALPAGVASYNIKLHFAETYNPYCKVGGRVMEVSAGAKTVTVDTFASAGCNTPYVLDINDVTPSGGIVVIKAVKVNVQNAFLSAIEAFAADGTPPIVTPSMSMIPSASMSAGATASMSVVPSASMSAGATPSMSIVPTASMSAGATASMSVVPSASMSVGATPSLSMIPSASMSAGATASMSVVPSASMSVGATPSLSMIPSASMSAGATASMSVVPSASMSVGATPSMSIVPTASMSAGATASMSVVPSASMSVGAAASMSVSPNPTIVEPPVGSETVARINFGSLGAVDGYTAADPAALTAPGVYNSGPGTVSAVYRQHVFGATDFTYTLSGLDDTLSYTVRLHFAEVFAPNCLVGKRIFSASVGTVVKDDIDVFAGAGACFAPYVLDFEGVVSTSGNLVVTLIKKIIENPMVSALEVFEGSAPAGEPSATPSVTPSLGSTPPPPGSETIVINCGAGGAQDIPVSGTTIFNNAVPIALTNNDEVYHSSRYGGLFTYSFDLAPGDYDVSLGFAEVFQSFCAVPGKRVFDVEVSGVAVLSNYDIFASVGCNTMDYKTFTKIAVAAGSPLTIKFTAKENFAQISYIRIRASKIPCVPASAGGELGEFEHAAHSVPGSYPPQVNADSPPSYVDGSGTGIVSVTLNAGGSHSHFFDPVANINGKIEYYEWTSLDTGEFLSNDLEFTYDFPLGTTRLSLLVGDNSCTEDLAETSVTVSGSVNEGSYCYYYDNPGTIPAPGGVGVGGESGPAFAAESKTVDYGFPSFSFDGGLFGARCFFSLLVDADVPDPDSPTNVQTPKTITVDTGANGEAQVYLGIELVSGSAVLTPGLNTFEVVYLRTATTGGAPKMTFVVDGATPPLSKISYDRSTVAPILASSDPVGGVLTGGTTVTVTGYGFYQRPTVSFGTTSVQTEIGGFSETTFVVKSPASTVAGAVALKASTPQGVAGNELQFAYSDNPGIDGVGFKFEKILEDDGSSASSEFATCIKVGVDGKLYMGTLSARVVVLEYNQDDLKVISRCSSAPLTDNNFQKDGQNAIRDILGIVLDPRDPVPKPYVATQTLFWFDKKRVDTSNTAAWRNGAVDRLVAGTDAGNPDICLVYDQRIVSNIPVSNHDHGVNGLEFTQDGDLLIAVGGFTNAGLPGFKLGNYWESENSAAIIIAKLSLGAGFDGTIAYTPDDNPKFAKVTGGDVENFATGFRNSFNLVLHSTNNVYATDNSCNASFGNTSETCDEDDDNSEYPTGGGQDWPGTVPHGSGGNQFSVSRPDKVMHVTSGSWYGHPNLNRGECAWVDPFDGLTGLDNPAPASYKAPLDTLKSSVNGIVEYTADSVFGGSLRGELIMSTFNNGNTYRMGVDGGAKTSGPSELAVDGGLSVAMAANGDLLFPRINLGDIFVLRPIVPQLEAKTEPSVVAAVPFRHGMAGGSTVTVGGYNFGTDPTVTIGGVDCPVVTKSAKSITCTVPAAGANAGALVDVAVSSGTVSAVSFDALWYMNV